MENLDFKVTKLEAARRQLSTAIDLYFFGGDPVSIRSLSEASLEVLNQLAVHAEIEPSNIELFVRNDVPADRREEFRNALNKTKNFLKHADRDPDGILDFNPTASLFLLHEAVDIYERLTGEIPIRFNAIRIWLRLKNPNIYKGGPKEEIVKKLSSQFSTISRQKFLEGFEAVSYNQMQANF